MDMSAEEGGVGWRGDCQQNTELSDMGRVWRRSGAV